jgi:hypothetical protein
METERKIWFKAKRYGIGWNPGTWQSWLITALFVLIVYVEFYRLGLSLVVRFILLFILIAAYLTIVVKTGEEAGGDGDGRKTIERERSETMAS